MEKKSPLQVVKETFGSKDKLVDAIVGMADRGDESADELRTRLTSASNAKLLRLHAALAETRDRFGGKAKPKRKRKLPFPEENEHTVRDLEDFLFERLIAPHPANPYDHPFYLGELALHAFREGETERAEEILSKVELAPHDPSAQHAVAHVAAYLARGGAGDAARRFVQQVEAAFEGRPDSFEPHHRAPVMAWIGATRHWLDGSAGAWLDEALALDVMTYDGGQAVMAMATACAFVGDFDRATETVGRLQSVRSSVLSELTDLVLEAWDPAVVEQYMNRLATLDVTGGEDVVGRLAEVAVQRGAARWFWERMDSFEPLLQGITTPYRRLVELVAGAEGSQAAFDLVRERFEQLVAKGRLDTAAPLLAAAVRGDVEPYRDVILDFARRLREAGTMDKWAAQRGLTALSALLPALGAMDALLALFDQAPDGSHWFALLEILPPDHPRFADAVERALASTDPYNQVGVIQAAHAHADDAPEVYEEVAEALVERAGRDRTWLEYQAEAFAAVGDLRRAYEARMRVTKSNRVITTSAMARGAIEAGHFSAAIYCLSELGDGYGGHGRQYEAMRALVKDCWDGVNRISQMM